ncbi:hypothetical protein D3C84_1049680 [compost metagenome]
MPKNGTDLFDFLFQWWQRLREGFAETVADRLASVFEVVVGGFALLAFLVVTVEKAPHGLCETDQ